MLESIRESNRIVNSTKPTDFQQQMNKVEITRRGKPIDITHESSPQCGFDRSSSIMENRYVCACGWSEDLVPSGKAKTYDDGKLPLAWLPWAAIDGLSEVQQYGHNKYKDFNNYRKGMEVSRNISCALRHIRDFMDGHDVDAESGHHPLKHAMCRLAFILQNLHDNVAIDDRYKK